MRQPQPLTPIKILTDFQKWWKLERFMGVQPAGKFEKKKIARISKEKVCWKTRATLYNWISADQMNESKHQFIILNL